MRINQAEAQSKQAFYRCNGDGDLYRHLGLSEPVHDELQPPTACCKLYGMDQIKDFNLHKDEKHSEEFNIPKDWGWSAQIPFTPRLTMHAENHILM